MKINPIVTSIIMVLGALTSSRAQKNEYNNADFSIRKATVTHHKAIGVTVWQIDVGGIAGNTTPEPIGQLDGATVLGYVFPTTLNPADVGFGNVKGMVALALTSHPDFDDTPLWDENNDRAFDNDGVVWHPHWVILVEDKRVSGGLRVKQFTEGDTAVVLPPTNPGMPMYMDSPGFPVTTDKETIRVVVPDYRINNQTNFKYDGVTALLKVNGSKDDLPLLGVYEVFSVASKDLSLPYSVTK
ncbi:hypothetical protein [Maribacter sp. 2-571]|uniref:hypothetical protein n=1 Tax=Maribacter sp. 2-571 TaxID=3417569 RepID=UPI003D35815C